MPTERHEDEQSGLQHYHDEGRDECPACADREIRRGEQDARRYQENRALLGEEYADAEERAWELKDPIE